MRHLLTILAALFLCSAPLHAQTLKSLMFNSTNGQVVANTGTNTLTFTSSVTINGDLFPEALEVAVGSNSATISSEGVQFTGVAAAITRTNLGLPLATLTNESNVTMMRALSGSTNTNHPYSGSISVVGTNNTNTLVFSNGVLQSVQ